MSKATRSQETTAKMPLVRGDLAGLDALGEGAIGVFCFTDERPLAGVAGFIDWRVCGRLSRCLEGGAFGCRLDEVLLLPTRGRFGRRCLFVFGLGPVAGCDRGTLQQAARRAREVMGRAGVRALVLAAPASRTTPRIETEFVRAVAEELGHDAKVLVESGGDRGFEVRPQGR